MTTVAVPTLVRYELHIGGTSVAASSGRTYETVNPYTGQSWATVADAGPEDVDAAAGAARAELNGEWGRTTPPERAAALRPWGSETRIRSRRGTVILVDEPAEQVPPANAAGTDR
jgi:aldehyde dehydrogenase (NAD+)